MRPPINSHPNSFCRGGAQIHLSAATLVRAKWQAPMANNVSPPYLALPEGILPFLSRLSPIIS